MNRIVCKITCYSQDKTRTNDDVLGLLYIRLYIYIFQSNERHEIPFAIRRFRLNVEKHTKAAFVSFGTSVHIHTGGEAKTCTDTHISFTYDTTHKRCIYTKNRLFYQHTQSSLRVLSNKIVLWRKMYHQPLVWKFFGCCCFVGRIVTHAQLRREKNTQPTTTTLKKYSRYSGPKTKLFHLLFLPNRKLHFVFIDIPKWKIKL